MMANVALIFKSILEMSIQQDILKIMLKSNLKVINIPACPLAQGWLPWC